MNSDDPLPEVKRALAILQNYPKWYEAMEALIVLTRALPALIAEVERSRGPT